MKKLLTVIAIVTMAAVSPAAAQTADIAREADMRCTLVGIAIMGAAGENVQMQQAGNMIALYYVGRLRGRAPDADLHGPLAAMAQGMTLQELDQYRQSCAQGAAAESRALADMVERISP
jgi:hypothetical protein